MPPVRLAGRALACALAAAALAGAPSPARAWNARGHRLVARVAEARLDSRARAAARGLLGGAHLAGVAAWADGEALFHRETGRWHWVNIASHGGRYDRARDCPDGECVVERIDRLARTLADRTAPREERARALRFLVHLVADVHQPMHAGRPEDRGGNAIALLAARGGEATNLHHAYDELPGRCTPPRKERAAARALERAIDPDDARAWASSLPADWATESHLLALEAYASLVRAPGGVAMLPADESGRCAMTRRRLAQAGVRLAAVIERALDAP